jgi:hypothetical protein
MHTKTIGYWAVGNVNGTQREPGDLFVSTEVADTGYYQDLGYTLIASYIEDAGRTA